MKSTKIISLLLVLVMCFSVLASCKKDPENPSGNNTVVDPMEYTYNTYVSISPSNWNELTYQDANDTEVLGWIQGSFFTYDFKYDENGQIVEGDFEVTYDAATKLEDVSATVDAKWGIPEGAKSYAYKITIRDDLKWEDGTPIKAEDFVYSMKEQLNPLFQNYRADSYYTGATIIVNAQEYVKQGQSLTNLDNGVAGLYTVADLVKGDNGVYTQPDGSPINFNIKMALDWTGGKTVEYYSPYLDATAYAALAALADEQGNIAITDETLALWATLIDTADWGNETPDYIPYYWVIPSYTYPVLDFSEVGIYAASDYELVIVLAKPLELLKEDGSLDFKAAYNMSSLPLVNEELYESCKIPPSDGQELWTTNYNSSVETTISWGPYKLESFQVDKQFTLVKNDQWYGYNKAENKGLYQTTRIVYDVIKEWNTAWVAFQAGNLDGIGIDVSIAEDYKNSSQAFFTPSDFVSSLQLQSSKEALAERQEAGFNKTILSYTEFRKALSLAIDRAAFAAECTTSSKAGFGLYNSMHYYDAPNGGVYRNTDEGKKVLCDIYNVDYTQYESLDAAVATITGYDLAAAKVLVTEAYNAALAAGDISATDVVKLTFGSGAVNETVTRQFNFYKAAWLKLVEGTPLEGRLELEIVDKGDAWANDFRAGGYDICMGGWQGAAWDPGYFLLAYLSPAYMYSRAWDTSSVQMTFTMQGLPEDHPAYNQELTMSLINWYYCLNGSGAYDFSSASLEEDQRLQLIAALEKEVLKVYYTVPVVNSYSASLISYQVDYVTYKYNTFMGYGGVKYMTYNYTDAQWAAECAKVNNQLDYTR